jgi:hypothetical protein
MAYSVAGAAMTKANRKAVLNQFMVVEEVEKKVAVVFARAE